MTTAENNIRAMEMLAEDLLHEFNEAICQYDDAVEHPDYYDVEASKKMMDEAERNYKDCLEEIEWMKQQLPTTKTAAWDMDDFEAIDAVAYNFGISVMEARTRMENGELTSDDVQRSLDYYFAKDNPYINR